MTAQINDTFSYRGEAHELVGIKGEGLFDPAKLGIRCTMMHTACWRGYIAAYAVEEEELRLASLEIQLADASDVQPILGASPTRVTEYGRATYERIGVRLPFTGGILLAQDFIRELYVHMGFHPAWKYRVVHELTFEEGRLLRAADRSQSVADIRARLAARPLGPDGTDPEELRRWIELTFDRTYL